MKSDRILFFIAAIWILALIIVAAVVPMATIKAMPLWVFVVIGVVSLLSIFAPIIPIGKKR